MAPVSILIVDDDTLKVKKIVDVLKAAGIGLDQISECRNALAAKEMMVKAYFDLAIIDIVLPHRIDDEPSPTGGIELVREIVEQRKLLTPGHIVGLTAHDEMYPKASEILAARGWALLKYDTSAQEWSERLNAIVQHACWAKEALDKSPRRYEADICVICALPDPELKSVLKIDWHWQEYMAPGDATVFHAGFFAKNDGRRVTVYAAAAPRMGLASTAALAAKMIHTFTPRYCFMTGIAAGVSGRCDFGDILVADPSWDYGSGKYEVVGKKGVFSAAPYQLQLDAETRNRLIEMAGDEELLGKISSHWPGDRPKSRLRIVLGPLASGGAVVADSKRVREIAAQQRKLIGIEMETYALFAAAAESAYPRPLAVSLKSVADFADEDKDDEYQRYAAYTSAQVFREFCERFV